MHISDTVLKRLILDLDHKSIPNLLSILSLIQYPIRNSHLAFQLGHRISELYLNIDKKLLQIPGIQTAEVGKHVVPERCLLPVWGTDEVGQVGDLKFDVWLGVVDVTAVGVVDGAEDGEKEAGV
jgi:hypothetical protein